MTFVPSLTNPYPQQAWSAIINFRYITDLRLLRLAEQRDLDVPRETQYIIAREYRVELTLDSGRVHTVAVPAGMLTDLASVPSFARGIVGRVGPHLEAAIVHDFLYRVWRDLPGVTPNAEMHRFADAVMLAGMQAAGMGWKAKLIHAALRVAGKRAFFGSSMTPRYVDLNQLPGN